MSRHWTRGCRTWGPWTQGESELDAGGWAAVSAFGPDGRCRGLRGVQLRSPPAVLQPAREEARRSRPGDCPCPVLMEYACGPRLPLSRHLRGRLKNPRVRLLCESSFSPLLVGASGGRESALIMGVWARGMVSRSGEPARHPISLGSSRESISGPQIPTWELSQA